MSNGVRLIGFTLLRNGLKYDYPFRESLRSLTALCGEAVVALGNSEDGTEAELAKWENLKIVPTIWDENKRAGGEILSEQTNIALCHARGLTPGGWGFYLQGDEVISERDYELIKADIAKADAQGFDCVSFRYLHFWQSYEAIAVNRRWYPQEIRAVKLSAPIESYGDAQSFRGFTKRFESDATIYHYGHVREAGAYAKKKNDFHRWWHNDAEISKVIAKGHRNDKTEETVKYLGPHPLAMQERVNLHGGLKGGTSRRVTVFGEPAVYEPEFLARVDADLLFTHDERELSGLHRDDVVMLSPPSFWMKVKSLNRFSSKVPLSLRSPQARPWTKEFLATMLFSEKNISVR
ncbi:MAG: hypothetical protein EOP11_08285 [Proteobacteria bacterium]|nr:MAG: hypothetical protein EOP11_08285 [Pseudomonadota bacterium]